MNAFTNDATRLRRGRALRRVIAGLALLAALVATAVTAAAPVYTGWSAPVNVGSAINTAAAEQGPAISKDGLSLYFQSGRSGTLGGGDLWVSQRESADDAWGVAENLGPTVNSAANELVPAFSRDGHWMFFASNRTGGVGGFDIWASWRPQIHDDFGWQAPINLGAGVNSALNEQGVGYFENDDAGIPQLFVGSTRPDGLGGSDLYMSKLQSEGSWGPATPIAELNSTANDNRPNIRHDGLEIYFHSARAGDDLWVATRDTVDAPWSTPVNLGPPVNTSDSELYPYLAKDGETLYFSELASSPRPGGFGSADVWMTTRSKSHGHK